MAEENLREDVFPRWDDAFIDDADPVPVAAAPAADVSDLRYRALVRNLPDTVVSIHDHDLRLVTMEGARLSEADFDAERMIGQPLSAYLPERDVQELEPHYRAALAGEPRSLEFQPSRRETIYHLEIVPLRMQEGDEPLGVFTVARDVTERRRARRAEEQRSAQQAAIATLGVAALEGREIGDLMDEAVTIVASTLGVELCELLQMTADHEALVLRAGVGWQPGLVRTALVPLGSEFYAGFAWGSRGQLAVEDWAAERRCSRTTLAMEHGVASTIAVVLGGKRRPLGVLAAHSSTERAFRRDEMDFVQAVANVLAEAISRQDAEDRVRHQALHDPLTELPNRTLLLERLGHWVGRAERTQARAALVFVDLDHFKVVNDALGHSVGDELLRRVADRLRAETRGSDTVARVGGDEFIVLSEDIGSEHEALALADRLAAALKPPSHLAGRAQYVTASMGLAFSE